MISKTSLILAVAAALICATFLTWLAAAGQSERRTISYAQFLQQVQAGRVAEVKIAAGSLGAESAKIHLKDGSSLETLLPLDYSAALKTMQQATVNVEIIDASNSRGAVLMKASPFLILLAGWVFFMTIGRPLLGPR